MQTSGAGALGSTLFCLLCPCGTWYSCSEISLPPHLLLLPSLELSPSSLLVLLPFILSHATHHLSTSYLLPGPSISLSLPFLAMPLI